ncbi:GGDEF domain-containing protein [Paenarthrobacter sp. NPDC090520]|uniref:GGDEF domain-containing protein n=1 Tax=Paenarthrobacter sp. NPDC090520 TaxID=3364382 RepID=UPI0037F5C5ED
MALAVVTLTLCVLFWDSFRRSRSAYSGWWCVALAVWLGGNGAYLLKGTAWSVLADPLGNALMVAGAFCMWGGFRSLRLVRTWRWPVGAAAFLTGAAALAESPADGAWAGVLVYFALMGTGMALAARELSLLGAAGSRAHRPLLAAAAVMVVYFAGRGVVYLVAGPGSDVFLVFFGPAMTCLLLMVLLVLVSFSMKALNNDQRVNALHERAARDGMTGLLNRDSFGVQAAKELSRMRSGGGHAAVILADLDHFKAVNDVYGHSAGDAAIRAFAAACMASVRRTDLVARYGGEEFILMLPGTTPERALDVAGEISQHLALSELAYGASAPTASYGIASSLDHGLDLEALTDAADAALYRAKAAGRNQAAANPAPGSG